MQTRSNESATAPNSATVTRWSVCPYIKTLPRSIRLVFEAGNADLSSHEKNTRSSLDSSSNAAVVVCWMYQGSARRSCLPFTEVTKPDP